MIPTPRPDRLLAVADVLLLLTAGLRTIPRSEPGLHADDLDDLALRADLPGEVSSGLRAIADLHDGSRATAWAADASRLFDGATVCPPNETAWIRRDKGHLLADVAGFYRAFGFEVASRSGEKADHVAAELQFVAVLLVYLARAVERDETDHVETTRRALGSFAADHVGAWLRPFCARLEATATAPGLRAVARTLPEALDHAVRCAGVPPPVATAPDAPAPSDGTPYECDRCPIEPV